MKHFGIKKKKKETLSGKWLETVRKDIVNGRFYLFRGIAFPWEEKQHVSVENPGNTLKFRVVDKPGHVTRA